MTQIALSALLQSATDLTRSGRWDTATQLLTAVTPTNPAEQLTLLAAQAEVLVDQDFAQAKDNGGPALELFEKALTDAPDETLAWDLNMLKLRKTYSKALFAGEKSAGEILGKQAEALRDSAPDASRAGYAAFYAGVIADNLSVLPEVAFAHYNAAADLAEQAGDELLTSYALRHLGDHAHTAGDLELARTHWERSTELRQKAGFLLGTLAQQALLATLTRDEGNPAGAAALAIEINRWSQQVDLPWLVAQSADLMHDPAS